MHRLYLQNIITMENNIMANGDANETVVNEGQQLYVNQNLGVFCN